MENFQSLSSQQGKWGEDIAVTRIKAYGFQINEIRAKLPGVEVDIIATNKRVYFILLYR